MNHPKRDILFKYFAERDKLDFCLEVLERGFKSTEKMAYYENYATDLNRNIAVMEDQHPFLTDVIEIIGYEAPFKGK